MLFFLYLGEKTVWLQSPFDGGLHLRDGVHVTDGNDLLTLPCFLYYYGRFSILRVGTFCLGKKYPKTPGAAEWFSARALLLLLGQCPLLHRPLLIFSRSGAPERPPGRRLISFSRRPLFACGVFCGVNGRSRAFGPSARKRVRKRKAEAGERTNKG